MHMSVCEHVGVHTHTHTYVPPSANYQILYSSYRLSTKDTQPFLPRYLPVPDPVQSSIPPLCITIHLQNSAGQYIPIYYISLIALYLLSICNSQQFNFFAISKPSHVH